MSRSQSPRLKPRSDQELLSTVTIESCPNIEPNLSYQVPLQDIPVLENETVQFYDYINEINPF